MIIDTIYHTEELAKALAQYPQLESTYYAAIDVLSTLKNTYMTSEQGTQLWVFPDDPGKVTIEQRKEFTLVTVALPFFDIVNDAEEDHIVMLFRRRSRVCDSAEIIADAVQELA